MKKTLLWTLISVCTTLLWIGVTKIAFAEDFHSTVVPAKPTIVQPAEQTTTTMPATQPSAELATTEPTTLSATPVEPAPFTAAQIDQLHKIIKDYLVSNPKVLVEASQALQAQQEKKIQTTAMAVIEQNKNALFDNVLSPSIGSKEAPVTLVEFFDYQCGHCRMMAPQIEKLVSEDKNIHLVFKELPIFGGMSEYAAKTALAAAMQSDKYYAFHNLLFTANGPLTKESIMGFAKKAGLNIPQLKRDMESPEIQTQIRDNFQLAQSLKLIGTPTFVIANKAQTKFAYIPGATSLADLQAQIKSVQ